MHRFRQNIVHKKISFMSMISVTTWEGKLIFKSPTLSNSENPIAMRVNPGVSEVSGDGLP